MAPRELYARLHNVVYTFSGIVDSGIAGSQLPSSAHSAFFRGGLTRRDFRGLE
jgi:hypothetical protein